jgi:glucose-1-phosphate cytidylyltransferase
MGRLQVRTSGDVKEMTVRIADVPVFILCGGLGTRLKEMTEFRPKPMIPVGPEPILVHIMRHYSHFGFSRFVLAWGTRARSSATTS